MADQVQERLDEMVPALRDLLNQGIFSEDEMHAIVSKRRNFEYLLHRNTTRKSDYKNYIKSEEGLERLRSLRYKKLSSQSKEKTKNHTSAGNIHIVQNIHSIYHRCTRKYSSDVSLFLQHMKFSKSVGSIRVLNRIVAQALHLHSKNVMLWIEVASQEFFGNEERSGGSIDSARILFQRGIRINPTSEDLYGQYFALELHYIQKSKGRKKLRKIIDDKKKQDDNDNEDSNMSEDEGEPKEETLTELATIIYRNAIKAVPDDVKFRLHFITICKLFPDTHSLQMYIINTIQQDFHSSPHAWIARATFSLEHKHDTGNKGFLTSLNTNTEIADSNKERDLLLSPNKKRAIEDISRANSATYTSASLQVIEEAVTQIPTIEMSIQAVSFLKDLLLTTEEQNDHTSDEAILSCLEKIFELVQHRKLSSPELISEYATYIISTGGMSEARAILQNATQQYPTNTTLWLQYASLAYKMDQSNLDAKTTTARSILRKATTVIPIYEEGHLLLSFALLAHLLSLASKLHTDEIQTLFQTIILLSSPSSSISNKTKESLLLEDDKLSQLSLHYLHYCITIHGATYAQQVYPTILSSCCKDSKSRVSLIEACIALEKSIALSSSKHKDTIKMEYKKRMDKIYKIASSFGNTWNELELLDLRQKCDHLVL